MGSRDPIGIADVPEACAEYDGYIPQLYKRLHAADPIDESVAYLVWIESEMMGLAGGRGRALRVAKRLMALDLV